MSVIDKLNKLFQKKATPGNPDAESSVEGVSVVADEVRKLAERTSLSTHEINETVSSILVATGGAVEHMRGLGLHMEESVALARTAGEAMGQIDQRAEDILHQVSDIADSTRQQSAASQEIALGHLAARRVMGAKNQNPRHERSPLRLWVISVAHPASAACSTVAGVGRSSPKKPAVWT